MYYGGYYPKQNAPAFIVPQPRNCMCNFQYLIILIMVILQFSKTPYKNCEEGRRGNDQLFDNSILFIITLFFVTCGGCGNSGYSYYY